MSRNEFELWDTYRQRKINDYRTQSAALHGMYDCYRYGCKPEHLDLVYQRPNDKQIYLGSGRDTALLEWFESIDELIVDLRLTVGTDIIGLEEWLLFNGYDRVIEDRGRTNTTLHMERYAVVLDNAEGIGGGIGATEFEATANALIELEETKNA